MKMTPRFCKICGQEIPIKPGLERNYSARSICFDPACARKRAAIAARGYRSIRVARSKKASKKSVVVAIKGKRRVCLADLVNATGPKLERVINAILAQ